MSGGTPEVCVEVNFGSPLPGTEASYVVNGMTHYIGQHPPSGLGTGNPEAPKSYNVPVCLLLQLIDLDDLASDLRSQTKVLVHDGPIQGHLVTRETSAGHVPLVSLQG